MNKLILVLFLSLAILAFTQASMISATDSDCNDYSTKDDKVCEINADPLLNKCVDRTGFEFKTTTVDAKGKCKESLNLGPGNTHQCGAAATLGCTVETADSNFTSDVSIPSMTLLQRNVWLVHLWIQSSHLLEKVQDVIPESPNVLNVETICNVLIMYAVQN